MFLKVNISFKDVIPDNFYFVKLIFVLEHIVKAVICEKSDYCVQSALCYHLFILSVVNNSQYSTKQGYHSKNTLLAVKI